MHEPPTLSEDMMPFPKILALPLLLCLALGPAPAAAELRQLQPDRPDKTEGPYTLDPGHVQLEMDLVSWHREQGQFSRSTGIQLGDFMLKCGLTPYADLEVAFDPFDS